MPAPDIATLLDYESAFEDALAAYLSATYTTWQVLTPRTTPDEEGHLETPRVEIAFAHTGTGSALHDRVTDGREYESHKLGTLTLTLSARRAASAQSLGLMRGQARQALLPATLALSTTAIPYYEILDITESASTPQIFDGNDEVQSVLTWAIHFHVKPEAWPAS